MSRYLSIARSTAALSIPQFSARLLSIALLPLYTRFLSPSDYGVLELLDLTFFFFSSIWGTQISSAIFFFLSKRGQQDEELVFSTALAGTLLLGVCASGVGILLSSVLSRLVFSSDAYASTFRLSLSAFAFGPLIEAGLALLRSRNLIALWNTVSVVRALAQATLNIVFLVFFHFGYLSIIYSNLITAAALGAFFLFQFYRRSGFRFDFSLYWGMIKYTLPLGIGTIATLLIHYGDRFFLQRYVSLADIGVYSLAYKIGMLTAFVHTPFTVYWSVERFRVARDTEGDSFYVRVFTYLVLVLTAAGLAIALASPIALHLLVPAAYHGAAVYIPWITLAYVLRSVGDHLRGTLLVEGRTGLESKVAIAGAIVCLFGYALLIPPFGVPGAVAATVGAFCIFALGSFIAGQRARHFTFESRRLALIASAAAASITPALILRPASLPAGLALCLALLFLFPALLYATGFLTPSEKESIVLLFGRLRSRPAQSRT